ncbi:glutathionylspermidine synthase family protein [Paenibacillus bovis]|uniref:Glutathionylspermidine synthase n=1 Tax=Paenibacillus bovis TaxID=1616788 RepID=A0A172ZDM0_9BACL|nr:glutathionylspermidine synthase family protein [Paenibacillus bovis]ANF95357.1 glutathionylspermidine synthase [Paenibacillus bovis]
MRRTVTIPLSREQLFTGEIARRIPYHTMYGQPYCLPAMTVYTADEYEQLRLGSERVDHLYRKTLHFVQEYLPDEYLIEQLGIHPLLAHTARQSIPWDGLTRLDWIISPDGEPKCIENNTDTPSGVPEVAFIEKELLRHVSGLLPASDMMNTRIQHMFREALSYYSEHGLGPKIHFTSYDWHEEDRMNTMYLLEQCQIAGIEAVYVPLEQLKIVPEQGLYDQEEQITILYRLYPLEYLVEDREEETGRAVGEDLLQLVAEGRLGLINPAQHILTQSKGFMATLWSLYERNDQMQDYAGFTLYNAEECSWIKQYLLPTYFTDEPFRQNHIPYVSKGYFGREGQGTRLIEQAGQAHTPQKNDQAIHRDDADSNRPSLQDSGDPPASNTPFGSHAVAWNSENADPTEPDTADQERLAAEAITAYYEQQPKIYQQLHPMEPIRAVTDTGTYEGYLLTGAFVIGGTFAGLLPRIGGKVTDNLACYCAAAVTPTERQD